jgi:hypothetical protein
MIDRGFQARAEQLAAEFNARYGVTTAWTDEQLERALADHGMPALATLPPGPRGIMAGDDVDDPTDEESRRRWRRSNAAHLLGHVILHGGTRCGGCSDWGTEL